MYGREAMRVYKAETRVAGTGATVIMRWDVLNGMTQDLFRQSEAELKRQVRQIRIKAAKCAAEQKSSCPAATEAGAHENNHIHYTTREGGTQACRFYSSR